MKKFYSKFIRHPVTVLFSNASIFIYTIFFILLDKYTSLYHAIPMLKSWDNWVYIQLPNLILGNAITLKIFILFILVYFLKSYIITFYAFDLQKAFTYSRKSALSSVADLKFKYIFRFIIIETFIYLVFGVVAITIYALLKLVWLKYYYSTVFILLALFLLLYPFFYMAISIAGLVSVLPLKSRDAISKAKLLFKKKNLFSLYLFYCVRGVLELSIFTTVPYFILKIYHDSLFSSLLIALTLSVPNVIFKTSSFAFKLDLLKDDDEINQIFSKHFTNDTKKYAT